MNVFIVVVAIKRPVAILGNSTEAYFLCALIDNNICDIMIMSVCKYMYACMF